MSQSATSHADPQKSTQPPQVPLKHPKYRHISRSAAKRESVQFLGSIKDLQLRFSQAGFVEHRPGAGAGVRGLTSVGEDDEENRPPGDKRPERRERERRPYRDVELQRVGVDDARREAKRLVGEIRFKWGLGIASSPSSGISLSPTTPVKVRKGDTRDLLVKTAEVIRRSRTLALSVSHTLHTGGGIRRVSMPSTSTTRNTKGRQSISTPSRPANNIRAVSYGVAERKSSLGPVDEATTNQNVLEDLRKAALEVLAGLRGLEERLRIPQELAQEADMLSHPQASRIVSPLNDAGNGSSSPLDTESTAPSFQRPLSAMSANYSESGEYYDEEDEYIFNKDAEAFAEAQNTHSWEERIVLDGREYRDLAEESEREQGVREAVRRWIYAAERIFGAVSVATEGTLPVWAKEEEWVGKSLERLHAFMLCFLPLNLRILLPSTIESTFRAACLSRLSDGYIIIQGYNAHISSSPKPWGYVPEDDIHDTLTSAGTSGSNTPSNGEEAIGKEKEWTFRRTGNLTCWAAALRHRYNLSINIPIQTASGFLAVPTAQQRSTFASPHTSPSSTPALLPAPRSADPSKDREDSRIDFDPVLVAKRGEGWEDMLSCLLDRWVKAAAAEIRDCAGSTS